jgi:hypothetical protein
MRWTWFLTDGDPLGLMFRYRWASSTFGEVNRIRANSRVDEQAAVSLACSMLILHFLLLVLQHSNLFVFFFFFLFLFLFFDFMGGGEESPRQLGW